MCNIFHFVQTLSKWIKATCLIFVNFDLWEEKWSLWLLRQKYFVDYNWLLWLMSRAHNAFNTVSEILMAPRIYALFKIYLSFGRIEHARKRDESGIPNLCFPDHWVVWGILFRTESQYACMRVAPDVITLEILNSY